MGKNWTPDSMPTLEGKVAVVTGAKYVNSIIQLPHVIFFSRVTLGL